MPRTSNPLLESFAATSAALPTTIPQAVGRRLTPFEHYMLADDSDDWPMSFFLRLSFQGTMSFERFEEAFGQTVARHPLLRSLVDFPQGSRPVWRQGSDSRPELRRLGAGECLSRRRLPRLDLSREPGIRAWFAARRDATHVWFQFHHSCCDGMAALQVLQQVFERYVGRRTATRPSGTSDSDADRRGGDSFSVQKWRGSWPGLHRPAELLRLLRFFGRRPLRVPTEAVCLTPHQGMPALVTRVVPDFATRWQRHREASPAGGTVNDMLLASLFAGLATWLQDRGLFRTSRPLRVAVPMNMRRPRAAVDLCENDSSMVFLQRSLRGIVASRDLVCGVSREMSEVKRRGLGASMLKTLAVLAVFPGVLPRVVRRQSQACTTVLSNLGRVFEYSNLPRTGGKLLLGDAVLDTMDFMVPLRRGVPVAFGVSSYAGQLSICLHYDPRQMSLAGVEQLGDRVVEHLNAFLPSGAGKTRGLDEAKMDTWQPLDGPAGVA